MGINWWGWQFGGEGGEGGGRVGFWGFWVGFWMDMWGLVAVSMRESWEVCRNVTIAQVPHVLS